jgi:hypothetical protein
MVIMLYMAVYTDTSRRGADGDVERHAAFHQVLSNAAKSGMIMHSVFDGAPDQTMYFLIETGDGGRLADVFRPLLSFGHLEAMPVIDRLAL